MDAERRFHTGGLFGIDNEPEGDNEYGNEYYMTGDKEDESENEDDL